MSITTTITSLQDYVPYDKSNFFFSSTDSACSNNTNTCGSQNCQGINYDTDIQNTDEKKQLCLNMNLYNNLAKIKTNYGGSDQRFTDLTNNYYVDLFKIAYSSVGICIILGVIYAT
jgi:hypothetical protein